MLPIEQFNIVVLIGDVEDIAVDPYSIHEELARGYRDVERAYYAEIFSFIVEHESALRGLLHNHCRNQYHLLDDLWSDVVIDMIPRAFKTFDPAKGETLKRHVFHTVKWYVLKWFNVRGRRKQKNLQEHLILDGSGSECTTDAKEMVQTINGQLEEWERTILLLHYGLGWSHLEIAEKLSCSREYIGKQVAAALLHAQKIAARMQRVDV